MILLTAGMAVGACEDSAVVTQDGGTDPATSTSAPTPPRWYRAEQVASGERLFQVHCAECHGANAEGTASWREAGPDGKYPPPPLNGTAHAWHHPLSILRRTVQVGGVPLGGAMPGFGDKLNEQEIDAILAWVQSHWSDKIYAMWSERNSPPTRGVTAISNDG
jgi:mono/diheme cytochrome c family protein